MANSVIIPTTIVANTGTGKTLVPYRLNGDTAEFVEDGAVGQPAKLTMKRVEPKPTKDYAGAARGEMKYTEQVADALGRLWPCVFTVSTSLPAFLTDAQKASFVTTGTMAAELAVSRDALAKKIIPQ